MKTTKRAPGEKRDNGNFKLKSTIFFKIEKGLEGTSRQFWWKFL